VFYSIRKVGTLNSDVRTVIHTYAVLCENEITCCVTSFK